MAQLGAEGTTVVSRVPSFERRKVPRASRPPCMGIIDGLWMGRRMHWIEADRYRLVVQNDGSDGVRRKELGLDVKHRTEKGKKAMAEEQLGCQQQFVGWRQVS